jgi:hypothetical protein
MFVKMFLSNLPHFFYFSTTGNIEILIADAFTKIKPTELLRLFEKIVDD